MSNVLDHFDQGQDPKEKRNKLIPLWMRVSSWFFMGLSVVLPPFFGYTYYELLESTDSTFFDDDFEIAYAFGFTFLIALLYMSGITGYAIVTKRRWAILFGIIFSVVASLIFGLSLVGKFNFSIVIVEMLVLFFLIQLIRIKRQWEN